MFGPTEVFVIRYGMQTLLALVRVDTINMSKGTSSRTPTATGWMVENEETAAGGELHHTGTGRLLRLRIYTD